MSHEDEGYSLEQVAELKRVLRSVAQPNAEARRKKYARDSIWRKQNAEHVRELARKRYAMEPERYRKKANEWRKKRTAQVSDGIVSLQKKCMVCPKLIVVTQAQLIKYRYRCAECRSRDDRSSYRKSRDRILACQKKWAHQNADKVKEASRRYREQRRDYLAAAVREWTRKNRAELSDWYILQRIARVSNLPWSVMLKAWRNGDRELACLVAAKRSHLKAKRLIKEVRSENLERH